MILVATIRRATALAASLPLAAVLLAPAAALAGALPLRIADPTANEKTASGDFFGLAESNVKSSLTLAAEKRWGNDYMHARYYNPNLGRFLSVDPVGGEVGSSQSWNRYSYVLNNPIRRIDPTGAATEEMWNWHYDVGQQRVMDASPEKRDQALQDYKATIRGNAVQGIVAIVYAFTKINVMGLVGGDSEPSDGGSEGQGETTEEAVKTRTTRRGGPGVEITREDGSVIDITEERVKEYVPEPRAKSGRRAVKFDEALPGSKGKKRAPTEEELQRLRDLSGGESH